MNSKQLILGAAIATVLALTSPAYAGHLGGAGALGGSLGGSLGGAGGAGRLTGAGGFDSQGDLNGGATKKAISKTAAKTDGTAPTAAAAKPSTQTAPAPAKPGASTGLTGGADQSVAAGSHTVSGGADGSLNAQHSKGSTSAAAAGDASASLN